MAKYVYRPDVTSEEVKEVKLALLKTVEHLRFVCEELFDCKEYYNFSKACLVHEFLQHELNTISCLYDSKVREDVRLENGIHIDENGNEYIEGHI